MENKMHIVIHAHAVNKKHHIEFLRITTPLAKDSFPGVQGTVGLMEVAGKAGYCCTTDEGHQPIPIVT